MVNNKRFSELKAAVKMMAKHMRGKKVAGLRVYEVPERDVRSTARPPPQGKPSSRG